MALPTLLEPRPETREIRVRFASRDALRAGLRRARSERWVRRARIDWERRELVLALAGGSGAAPHLRLVDDPARQAAA